MRHRLQGLDGIHIQKDGRLIDNHGHQFDFWVADGSHEIVNRNGQVVGSITADGAIYDYEGQFVTCIIRRDSRHDRGDD